MFGLVCGLFASYVVVCGSFVLFDLWVCAFAVWVVRLVWWMCFTGLGVFAVWLFGLLFVDYAGLLFVGCVLLVLISCLF